MINLLTVIIDQYQEIDWKRVREYGVECAILRINNENEIDSKFMENYDAAKRENIRIGVYKYSTILNTKQAEREAIDFVNLLSGRPLDLPFFYKVGNNNESHNMSKEEFTKIINSFTDVIHDQTPYRAGIYCSSETYFNRLDLSNIKYQDIMIAETSQNNIFDINCKPKIDMCAWHYTYKEIIPGISERISLAMFFNEYYNKDMIGWLFDKDDNLSFYDTNGEKISNNWLQLFGAWYWCDQTGIVVKDIIYRYKNNWYYILPNYRLIKLTHVTGTIYKWQFEEEPTREITITPDMDNAIRYPGLLRDK